MKRLYALCTLLLTLAAAHVVTSGSQRHVLRVPADFATIQQAVDAALPGDVIRVAPGTYCERVLINEKADLTLRAAPGVGNPAIMSGTCEPALGYTAPPVGGSGIHSSAFHVRNTSGVEISGFIIEGFATGIVLRNSTDNRVFNNEIRDNVFLGSGSELWVSDASGISLIAASFNDVQQNWIHDNGHLGIGLVNGSNGNLIRANRLIDNQTQFSTFPSFSCSLMLWGTASSGNWIVENEVTNSLSAGGAGIMIGPNPQTGNLVAQNRIHGHWGVGIVVRGGSYDNVIEQNNATGNGLKGDVDLVDLSTLPNLWQRNQGTCAPGNAGCD